MVCALRSSGRLVVWPSGFKSRAVALGARAATARRCGRDGAAATVHGSVRRRAVHGAFLNVKRGLQTSGDERIGEFRVDGIAAWRKSLPQGKRYRGLRSLRQVLAAGERRKWIEDNPAAHF